MDVKALLIAASLLLLLRSNACPLGFLHTLQLVAAELLLPILTVGLMASVEEETGSGVRVDASMDCPSGFPCIKMGSSSFQVIAR